MGPWAPPVQKGGMDAVSEPLCFLLMPFGKKPDGSGGTVDFDAVYRELIAPAIDRAGLEPLRADEESTGGIIHKPMFERLILCEFAVADLTTANANVFYERRRLSSLLLRRIGLSGSRQRRRSWRRSCRRSI